MSKMKPSLLYECLGKEIADIEFDHHEKSMLYEQITLIFADGSEITFVALADRASANGSIAIEYQDCPELSQAEYDRG